MKVFAALFALFFGVLFPCAAEDPKVAARAINALGVDLYRTQAKGGANLLLSPYSIEIALAMTYTGADGDTRAEVQKVMHFAAGDYALHSSLGELNRVLYKVATDSYAQVKKSKEYGGPTTPIEFNVASQLFVQKGFSLEGAFLHIVDRWYGAPAEEIYFGRSEAARKHINDWVEDRTRRKIRDLIPAGVLNERTRLVLANALYLRAPWDDPFSKSATKSEPFHVPGGKPVRVKTMTDLSNCRYAARPGFQIVGRPYAGGALQFVIVLPDESKGLPAVEQVLTSELLAEFAALPSHDVMLHFPKFRIEPPTVALAEALQSLGMKTAFDQPPGSANFGRMVQRKTDDYLYISEVLHKTFLALDEEGTEAAAATAVVMAPTGAPVTEKPKSIVVRVDRPFLFAIQHVESGACLFLGRVVDPR